MKIPRNTIFKNIHLAQEIAKENNKAAQLQMKTIYDHNISAVSFEVDEQVLLRDKMSFIQNIGDHMFW